MLVGAVGALLDLGLRRGVAWWSGGSASPPRGDVPRRRPRLACEGSCISERRLRLRLSPVDSSQKPAKNSSRVTAPAAKTAPASALMVNQSRSIRTRVATTEGRRDDGEGDGDEDQESKKGHDDSLPRLRRRARRPGSVSSRGRGGRRGAGSRRACRAGCCRCRTWVTARTTGSRRRTGTTRSPRASRSATRPPTSKPRSAEAGPARVAVVDEDREQAGVLVVRRRDAADVPAVAGGEQRQAGRSTRARRHAPRPARHAGATPAHSTCSAEQRPPDRLGGQVVGRQVQRLLAEHLAGGDCVA